METIKTTTMKITNFFKVTFAIFIAISVTQSSCVKPPYKPDYENASGTIIGKEICSTNGIDDYWLIDLSVYPNTKQYGDTLIVNSIKYTNVVKTKDLTADIKIIGYKVSIDFYISNTKIETTGCNCEVPITYLLKEITIINVFDI